MKNVKVKQAESVVGKSANKILFPFFSLLRGRLVLVLYHFYCLDSNEAERTREPAGNSTLILPAPTPFLLMMMMMMMQKIKGEP